MAEVAESPYPYPPRASEFVKNFGQLSEVVPLKLSPEDIGKLRNFENGLFEEYKAAASPVITSHSIFPEAFTTEEGKKVFIEAYFAEDTQPPRLGDVNTEDIKRIFSEIDLSKVPKAARERAYNFSYEWAQDKFKNELLTSNGEVGEVSNPERISRVVNPREFEERVKKLRDLKGDIKRRISDDKRTGDLPEAERLILDIYRRRINVSLADIYEYTAPKELNLQRMDHFLNGVGLDADAGGFFQSAPVKLREYAQARVKEPIPKSSEYAELNSIKIGSDDVKKIAEVILKEYGLADGERKWKIVVEDHRSTFGIQYKSGTEIIREIRVPLKLEIGLIDALTVLSHEIEGHVLRHVNHESSVGSSLKLFDEKSSGRGAILSEGAAMYVEGQTQKAIVGYEGHAEPYYFAAIEEKTRGGSFKEVFYTFANLYSERKFGVDLKSSLGDGEKFKDVFSFSYPRVMRIFRRNTPLNDRSGYLTSTDVLDYIEQEIVLDHLNRGKGDIGSAISRIAFVSGVDLHSAFDLKRLGLLNFEKIEGPRMVTAKIIWPKIKSGIESSKNIHSIIAEL